MKKVSLIVFSILLLLNFKTFSSNYKASNTPSQQGKSYNQNQISSVPLFSQKECIHSSTAISNSIEDDVDDKNKDKTCLNFFCTVYTLNRFTPKNEIVYSFLPQQFSEKIFLLHSVLRL